MMEKFDVIVVGAGTAGCLAAKTTAEAGLKVQTATNVIGKSLFCRLML